MNKFIKRDNRFQPNTNSPDGKLQAQPQQKENGVKTNPPPVKDNSVRTNSFPQKENVVRTNTFPPKENIARTNTPRENPNRNNDFRRRDNRPNEQRPPFQNQGSLSVSIIIPFLNEEESLKELSEQIEFVMAKERLSYEVIFVDDGSTDSSLKVVKEINRKNKRFKCYSFRRNYGKSAALNLGFKKAKGDFIITMDADLQDDPNEIPNLIKKLNEGYDLVSGWKKKRHDPITKTIPSRFFNFVTALMSGIKIHDFNCGLKAYKKDVCKDVNVYGELHRYIPIIAKQFGYKISEIPVLHHKRKYGKTKFGWTRFLRGFLDLLTILFNSNYATRPLHFFGGIASVFTFSGVGICLYLTYEWAFNHVWLAGRPLLFFGVLLIILGIQFFSLGFLGEMITRSNIKNEEPNMKDIVK